MKIGLIFSTIFASPGLSKGKIFAPGELFTHLSNGLIARRHEVIVFGPADTPTRAKVVAPTLDYIARPPPYFKFRGLPEQEQAWIGREFAKRRFELETIVQCFECAKQHGLDIIHNYHESSLFLTHYLNRFSPVPVVYSLHDPLPPNDTYEYQELTRFADHNYISLTDTQRRSDGLALNFVDTVYHGVDLSEFPFVEQPQDLLLFMGRLMPEKGLHDAIAAAIKLGMKLEIGTQFPKEHEKNPYFEKEIKPFLMNPLIAESGLVTDAEKARLYGAAKALLFPIHWEEPFGMVMIEAMACGTPVVAYNRGSVSEIVRDGVTGFIVDPERGVEGLVEAVRRIGEIDRAACRRHVAENFTVEKMVEGYERVYNLASKGLAF